MTPGTDHVGRVMGTDASVIVHGNGPGAVRLFERLELLEHRWSRFLAHSEITRLNHLAGRVVVVSSDTFDLIAHLIAAHRLTGGRFDPTLLPEISSLGYDRPFAQLTDDRVIGAAFDHTNHEIGDIELIKSVFGVVMPSHLHLDPGGLGKGLAADLVAEAAMGDGADGVLVNVGGDIVCRGTAPDGGPWRIAIESADEIERVIELNDGAVATSDVAVRSWTVDGDRRHHLLDPATGRPLTRVLKATVVAGSGWWAEAMTKAAMVSIERHDGWFDHDRAEELGVSALVTTDSGVLGFGPAEIGAHV